MEIQLLIVEDSTLQQAWYTQAFQSSGFRVAFCDTVSMVVSLSNVISADCVIVDLELPDGQTGRPSPVDRIYQNTDVPGGLNHRYLLRKVNIVFASRSVNSML